MRVTITTEDGGVFPLDVSDELPFEDLKALLEVEVGIPAKEMFIVHNMMPLRGADDKTLKDFSVQEEDVLLVVRMAAEQQQTIRSRQPQPRSTTQAQSHSTAPQSQASGTGIQLPNIDWSSIQVPSSSLSRRPIQTPPTTTPPSLESSMESILQHFLSNPEELATLQQRNPELAEALMSGDYEWMSQAITQYRQQIVEEERQRSELSGLDPWSEEYQQRLAENIRRRNIQENMETALEHNPEIFLGRVHMLYISCKVNGQVVKALVDTGAQMTVMNVQCAQRCDIMRLLDRRYASYAFGVGRQRILGVIHLGQIQIGDDFLASSFRVLEDQSHELILGLDMLKRHQCCVDLSKDVLRIGTTGKETKFLPESEVPQATYDKEEKNVLEDEDHEMASAIAKSEAEYKKINGELPPDTPPPSSVATPSSTATPTDISEESIQSVMAAGFKREIAIEELRKCNGDPMAAKASLFARLFKF